MGDVNKSAMFLVVIVYAAGLSSLQVDSCGGATNERRLFCNESLMYLLSADSSVSFGLNLLGDFEYPEQSQGSQHTDTKRCSWFNHVPDHLTNAAHNHLERRAEDKLITLCVPNKKKPNKTG